MLRATLICGLLLAFVSCDGPSRDELLAQREAQKFQTILDTYTDQYFKDYPHRATAAGMHQYDELMPAFTRERIVARSDHLRNTLNDLATVDPDRLPDGVRYDFQILDSKLRGETLEFNEIRRWLRDPNQYNEVITRSLVSLVDFDFKPPEERLKSLINRLNQVPEILDTMQSNVENPAPVYVDHAKEEFAGTAAFIKTDLARAFSTVENAELQNGLKTAIESASKAYDKSIAYLGGLGRKARGGHSLGPKVFQQKLFFEEMIETPVAALTEMGEAELERIQSQLAEAAKKIDPGRSMAQVVNDLARDPFPPDQIADAATGLTADTQKFITEKDLLTLPDGPAPPVRSALPYAHPMMLAHLDTPGALDESAESFFTITLPDPSWNANRKSAHLQFLNRAVLPILSIHETYPGHYVQFLKTRQASSRVRKVFGSVAFREGWALYAEEMMLDAGYGNDDPRLRVAQLHSALVSAVRYLAAIRVHGQGTATETDIADFFMREAYLGRSDAQRESRRLAVDPGVVKYTLGKIEILKLRDDYRQARGAEFSLKQFHDELLGLGYPPIKIVREALLPEGSGKGPSS